MPRLLVPILLLLAALTLPVHARAGSDVIITGHWPPYVDVEAPEGGLATAIVMRALAAADLHTRLDITPLPWLRCEKLVREGEALAAYPYAKTREREAYGLYTDPVVHSRVLFFHNADKFKNFEYLGPESLRGLRVGGVRGYFYSEFFEDNDIDVVYFYDLSHALKALAEGLIDVLPENELVGWARIATLFPGQGARFAAAPGALTSHDLYLMVSKEHPNGQTFVEAFNTGLSKVRESGILARLQQEYGMPY